MKKIITIVSIITFLSCKTQKMTYYHGYLYNTNGNPLSGLILMGKDHKEDKSTSNEQGYFKMKMKKNWMEKYIYIYDENKIIDSIQIIRTHPEYGARYYFVEGRKDTLFLDLKK